MRIPLGQLAPRVPDDAFVAPGAMIIGDVELGASASVWYGAVLRGDVQPIRIGARTNVQDGAIVHATSGRTPTTVGDDVTVGHRAILHGCTVGDASLIGMGAIVLDDAVIGRECLVGAGALVTSGTVVPDGSLVVGSPAKVRRALTDEERAALHTSAAHYVDNALLHAAAIERLDDD